MEGCQFIQAKMKPYVYQAKASQMALWDAICSPLWEQQQKKGPYKI
jgi:hypothetical protein